MWSCICSEVWRGIPVEKWVCRDKTHLQKWQKRKNEAPAQEIKWSENETGKNHLHMGFSQDHVLDNAWNGNRTRYIFYGKDKHEHKDLNQCECDQMTIGIQFWEISLNGGVMVSQQMLHIKSNLPFQNIGWERFCADVRDRIFLDAQIVLF